MKHEASNIHIVLTRDIKLLIACMFRIRTRIIENKQGFFILADKSISWHAQISPRNLLVTRVMIWTRSASVIRVWQISSSKLRSDVISFSEK